jgi:hypothetical protein
MDIVNNGASANINDVAAKFVSRALVNAGVSGITTSGTVSSALPTSTAYLISLINSNSNFKEVDVNTLKIGDIVLIGQGCTEPYSIGIVALVPDSGKPIYVYTNLNGNVQMENTNLLSSIDNKWYIYKAYRYVGDLSSDEKNNLQLTRTTWTLDSAITRVAALKGSYTDNKAFVDQLIFDGILTEKDCGDVRGTSSLVGAIGGAILQKDMAWLKNLLLSKKATTTTATSSGRIVSIPSTQYNTYKSTFEKYASINHPTVLTIMTSNDFKALLAAIAQQNNWGSSTRGGSEWLMGYQTGDVNYEGVDKQVSTVSGILKSVLEGTLSNPKSAYYSCISTTILKEKLHCTLSVYYTGKIDSAGILGIGANTEGNNYADSVLTLWDSWKSYFSSQ